MKTKIINGEEIVQFAKDSNTNKDVFKQALFETIVEVGEQLLSGFFKGKK